MKLRFIYCRSNTLESRLIRRVTGGDWHHVVAAFQLDKAPMELFESTTRTYGKEKNGVRGPFSYQELRLAYPDHYMQEWLPLSPAEAWRAYHKALWAVDHISYASPQLWRNYLHERTGLGIYFGSASRARWTCSEFCARLLPYDILCYYLHLGEYLYDDIVPSGKCGLYEAMKEVIRTERCSRMTK